MATWLAYLKSKLLLPEDEEEDFKAVEVAEKIEITIKKIRTYKIIVGSIIKKKRLGRDIFTRGMKGGIKSIYTPVYDINLYELLKTYAYINMQKSFQNYNIPKLPVLTTEQGILNKKKLMN